MKRVLLTALTLAVLVWVAGASQFGGGAPAKLPLNLGAIHPRISPNGQRIAVSYQGAIWTVPRDGGTLTRLTDGRGFDIEPVWSPDGKRIAYVNTPTMGAGELRVIDANTGTPVKLPNRVDVLGTAVYQKIEFIPPFANRVLGVLRVDGEHLGLGWVDLDTGETKSLLTAPTWSRFAMFPGGNWLAYTATMDVPGEQGGNDGPQTDIWRISLNGGGTEKIVRFPSRIYDLCWKSSESLIVVSDLGGVHNDLWEVPTQLPLRFMHKTTFGQADEDRPSVSSHDGVQSSRWLVYSDNRQGATALVVRDLRSGHERTVAIDRLDFRQPTGELVLRIPDDKNGLRVTARVSVEHLDGKFFAPPGSLHRVLRDVGHFYWPIPHGTSWSHQVLPAGKYRVRAFRGPEYKVATHEVDVIAGKTIGLDVELERWTHQAERGWYSGENHIHANYGYGQWYNTPETMLAQSAGEDLNVSNFMVANSDTDGIFDREFFRGGVDPISTPETILYWNQEFRSTIWGHMTLVNLKQVVEPIMTGFKDTTNPWDVPTNSDIADRTHWQKGIVNYTHVAQNPDDPYQNPYTGKGIPIDVALGKIDSLDINNTYAGTVPLWYRMLNCGFHLTASAGTDCFLNRISSRLPGSDRVYVKVEGGMLNYSAWIDGLRAGQSFVTNGPMLELTVGNHGIGDTIKLDAPTELSVKARATSQFPLDKVELVQNGQVIATATLSADKREGVVDQRVKLERSGWFSFRATGPGHADHPAGSLDAHTSPIYVEVRGTPAGSRADAEYFLKWIERLSIALRVRDRVPNDELRRHIQNQLESARSVYLKIAEQGR
jgi:hypothetical protein